MDRSYNQMDGLQKGKTIIGLSLTLILLVLTSVFTGINFAVEADSTVVGAEPQPFTYSVYCPIASQKHIDIINLELGLTTDTGVNVDYVANPSVYVVIAKAVAQTGAEAKLYYCGLAREWTASNCSNAQMVCSIPGPMFYFKVKEEATIMWVNNVYMANLQWVDEGCYAAGSADDECIIKKKQANHEECAFHDPTSALLNKLNDHRLRKQSIPLSPHIHGLEVRPVFDGNPLSWYNVEGDHGPGFKSLDFNPQYFQSFFNEEVFKGRKPLAFDFSKRTKVMRTSNDQPPGLLFYHDHAMKSTKVNVGAGLGGLYVIHDPEVEKDLPSGIHDHYILYTKESEGDARAIISGAALEANEVYDRSVISRFKILNMHFDNTFHANGFVFYATKKNVNGVDEYTEVNPEGKNYDLTTNRHYLPFSVVGTDTSLFHSPIHNQLTFDLGPAERIDLIIRFGQHLPASVSNIYFICLEGNSGETTIKFKFNVHSQLPKTTPKNPESVTALAVPYDDLKQVAASKIAVRRMRPLFSFPMDVTFTIGGHYMFDMGASDNSKIGTYEEFYMINNLWEGHPIHIHLVNFQVTHSYSLKRIKGPEDDMDCTFYMLDYFRLSNIAKFQGKTNNELCHYLWKMPLDEVKAVYMEMNTYELENITQVTPNGVTSGMDVMQLSNGDAAYAQAGCALSLTHKYLCEETTDTMLQPHERRWKDTALIDPFNLFVIRVRWAAHTYSDPTMQTYPYFSVPESHLTEYPGYVYHCHILPHEDNEMMRPIMLQHSDLHVAQLKAQAGYCDRSTWRGAMECLNIKNSCNG